MSKNKKRQNLKTKFTREELLGEGNKTFQLNQAEYVSKKIIDEILFLTFQQIRFNNVKKMEFDYSIYRTFENLQRIINLGLLKPEIEYEKAISFDIKFDIKPPKIDSYASNKSKIITTVPKEEIPQLPPKKEEALSKLKKLKGKVKLLGTFFKKSSQPEYNTNLLKKKEQEPKKKETAPRELPMDAKSILSEQKEEINEIEQMKLKGMRAYFQEREIELQKRKIYEHELAEKKKEEEKKMKQVMELINSPNNNLISWDDEGRFVSIKQMKETDFKKFPEPKQNVIHNKIEYDNQKIYDLDKNGRQKKFDTSEIIKEIQPIPEPRIKYYQPDPYISIPLEKGIDMESYGLKKTGGQFDKGDGRFTLFQYYQELGKIKPNDYGFMDVNYNDNYDDNVNYDKKELEKIDEDKKENNVSKINEQPKFSRMYFLFKDEINNNNVNVDKNLNQEDILHKKKKKNEIKKQESLNKIVHENIKFDEIINVDDKKLYNAFRGPFQGNNVTSFSPNVTVLPKFGIISNVNEKKSIRDRRIKNNQRIQSANQTTKNFLPKSIIKAIDKAIKEENNEMNENREDNKIVLPRILSGNNKFGKKTGKGIYNKKINNY
jgi:hypothetical protein